MLKNILIHRKNGCIERENNKTVLV